jgi:hypothetical protein
MAYRVPITQVQNTDEHGNPTGGKTMSPGMVIQWQDGPLKNPDGTSNPRSGAFVEDVILAAIGRLQFFNESKFRCRENSLAITHLEEALHWMDARTQDREERGVEGKHEL